MIVDNAQALFAEPIQGVKSVYSPRKYVGIPDGGIAYIEAGLDINQYDRDVSYERCSHLLKRLDLGLVQDMWILKRIVASCRDSL